MAEKKKLKDTKIGQFLITKAPKVAEVVGDLLPDKGVLGIVKNLINSAVDLPDEVKKEFNEKEAEFELEFAKLENDLLKTQVEQVNQTMREEAKSEHWWISSWRPFIGFTFGISVFNNWIIVPYLINYGIKPIVFDPQTMMVVGAILGIASLGRSATKYETARKGK